MCLDLDRYRLRGKDSLLLSVWRLVAEVVVGSLAWLAVLTASLLDLLRSLGLAVLGPGLCSTLSPMLLLLVHDALEGLA